MILRGKSKNVLKIYFFVFKRKRVDKKLKNTKNSKKTWIFTFFLQVDHPSVTGSNVGENGGVLVFWFLVFTGGIWLKTWKSVMIYLFSHRHLTLQKIWGGSSETSKSPPWHYHLSWFTPGFELSRAQFRTRGTAVYFWRVGFSEFRPNNKGGGYNPELLGCLVVPTWSSGGIQTISRSRISWIPPRSRGILSEKGSFEPDASRTFTLLNIWNFENLFVPGWAHLGAKCYTKSLASEQHLR